MQSFECRGAPRDLGLDQGRALRTQIRTRLDADSVSGRLAWLRRDPRTRRLERDLRRYFPHQAEWLEGMAMGAGVSMRALVRELALRMGEATEASPVLGLDVTAGVLRLLCALPQGVVLRRAEPEGRFRSLEVGWPEGSAPLLGVNEAGFAVAVARARRGLGGRGEPGGVLPPAALFARDCLERFDCVDAALEWCGSRPAAPGGALLFADAAGDLAGVDFEAGERSVLRPVEGCLFWGASEAALAPKPVMHDAVEASEAPWIAALAALAPTSVVARVDPVARRLCVDDRSWVLA